MGSRTDRRAEARTSGFVSRTTSRGWGPAVRGEHQNGVIATANGRV
jgi:hypothetical protein